MVPGERPGRRAGDDLAVAGVLRAVAGAGEAVGHAQRRAAHLHRLRLGQRLGADRAAEVRADGRDGVEDLALAEDEQPLLGQELQAVRELGGQRRASPWSARRRRRSAAATAARPRPGSPMPTTPAPIPSLIRNSRRSFFGLRSYALLVARRVAGSRAPGGAKRSGIWKLLHRHGVGGAADGAQPAADAAVVVLDHRATAAGRSPRPAPRARPSRPPAARATRTGRSRGSTRGRRPRSGCTARTSRGRRSSARGRRGSARPGARRRPAS